MDERRLERIEVKLDDVIGDLSTMNVTLTKQAAILDKQSAILDVHVKRTDELQAQVVPLTDLRKEMKGVVKLIYLIAALAAIIECVRLFK